MMNSFEANLTAAKRRHRIVLIAGGICILLLVLGMSVFLAHSRGVSIRILPDEITDHGVVEITSGLAMAVSGSVYGLGGDVSVEVSAPGYPGRMFQLTWLLINSTLSVMRKTVSFLRPQLLNWLPEKTGRSI